VGSFFPELSNAKLRLSQDTELKQARTDANVLAVRKIKIKFMVVRSDYTAMWIKHAEHMGMKILVFNVLSRKRALEVKEKYCST
jgi:hypothetical protein